MADKKKMSLTTQILIATIGGIVFGSIIGDWAANLKFIGDIFIRLIQMSVVLLVMTSVMGAIGNVDAKGAGKMGFHTFKWIIIFTVFSTLLGLALGAIVKPGADIDLSLAGEVAQTEAQAASIQDTLLGFVPTNIINSMASGSMVPCILFSIFFGLAMGTYKRQTGNTIVGDVINAFNAVIMNIIKMVMSLCSYRYLLPPRKCCRRYRLQGYHPNAQVPRLLARWRPYPVRSLHASYSSSL